MLEFCSGTTIGNVGISAGGKTAGCTGVSAGGTGTYGQVRLAL